MPTYIGFSTQHTSQVRKALNYSPDGTPSLNPARKSKNKFRTLDEELVIRDLINAFNINQGEKPGKPEFGTTLWSFVFEPNTLDVQMELQKEVNRVASYDPRLSLASVQATPYENGISLELEMYIKPFNNPIALSILLDQNTKKAYMS
jgi:phage baseplate assembly protein W